MIESDEHAVSLLEDFSKSPQEVRSIVPMEVS
jgi:hypothetical protein